MLPGLFRVVGLPKPFSVTMAAVCCFLFQPDGYCFAKDHVADETFGFVGHVLLLVFILNFLNCPETYLTFVCMGLKWHFV